MTTSFATQQPLRVGFTIIVSRPCAALRSNGGHGHYHTVSRARLTAKEEAFYETTMCPQMTSTALFSNGIVNISYTELLSRGQHAMDDDNLIGAMKPYRDGIALALSINDKSMRVQPCGPCERGAVSGVSVRVWIDEVTK